MDSRKRVSGPAKIDVTSTISQVRRSRNASLSSLRRTVNAVFKVAPLRCALSRLAGASPPSGGRAEDSLHGLGFVGELYKSVFERFGACLGADLLGAPV